MPRPTIQKILLEFEPHPQNLLPALKRIDSIFGHVSQRDIYSVADYFSMSPSETFSALSFFDDINFAQKSDVEIKVCVSAPCELRGSRKVLTEIERFLGVRLDRDKTAKLEVKSASCQGRCQRGPVVIVNGNVYDQVKPEAVDDILGPYFNKS